MKVTGVEFSRLCNVSRQAIYKLVREGKLNKDKDKNYDLTQKDNLNFLYTHGVTKKNVENYISTKPTKILRKYKKNPAKSKKVIKKKPTIKKKVVKVLKSKNITEDIVSDDDFENTAGLPTKMMNLNLKQLVRRYGGPMMLKNWVDILNKLMQANERDQKIQMKSLDLIEKNFVISRLFSYLEVLHNQIFNIPPSFVDHIIALAISKKSKSRVEIISIFRKEIEKLIKDAKTNIDKELDNLKNKFDKSDIDDE